jgi:periplasmic copper chaperone A
MSFKRAIDPFLNIVMECILTRFWLFLVPLFALLASSCSGPPELRVREAVVKLSPVEQNPSALYFTVEGGASDVELLRISSPSVIRTEMHDTVSDPKTGMLTMIPIQRIKVPAKGKVIFKRGGKHVMMFGINKVARRLGKMNVEFLFSSGDRILVSAPVEPIAASDGDHSGH